MLLLLGLDVDANSMPGCTSRDSRKSRDREHYSYIGYLPTRIKHRDNIGGHMYVPTVFPLGL
jgi:hypothetical protein